MVTDCAGMSAVPGSERFPKRITLAKSFQAVLHLLHMVGVAQLAEHWVVAPEVVGSSPITHPRNNKGFSGFEALFYLISSIFTPISHKMHAIISFSLTD
jgi:hypothetical protein